MTPLWVYTRPPSLSLSPERERGGCYTCYVTVTRQYASAVRLTFRTSTAAPALTGPFGRRNSHNRCYVTVMPASIYTGVHEATPAPHHGRALALPSGHLGA